VQSTSDAAFVDPGVGTIIAIYSTYWQLQNYKKGAAINPSGARSVGVEQSTEDGTVITCRKRYIQATDVPASYQAFYFIDPGPWCKPGAAQRVSSSFLVLTAADDFAAP
jgi:hypothetical protein